jgi:hypothetical protein
VGPKATWIGAFLKCPQSAQAMREAVPPISSVPRRPSPVTLKPGKYTCKFIVDNKWINDPSNDIWEENEYGTGNSVLWIEP